MQFISVFSCAPLSLPSAINSKSYLAPLAPVLSPSAPAASVSPDFKSSMTAYDAKKRLKPPRSLFWTKTYLQQQITMLATHKRRFSVVISLLVLLMMTVAALIVLWLHVNHQTLLDRGVLRLKVPDRVFERVEALKAAMPRSSMFSNMSVETMHQQLPVWVISLARATQRRQHMLEQVQAAGVAGLVRRSRSAPLYGRRGGYTGFDRLYQWVASLTDCARAAMNALAGVTNYEFIDAADYRNASSYTEAELHK